jgi:hypothetical protein
MARQAFRFTAQDGRTRSFVRCVVGRRPSWLRVALLASVAFATAAHAQQDATWLANPASGIFNSAGNWDGNAVPTGNATFNASSQRDIGFSRSTQLGGISVTAGAGAYTFTPFTDVLFDGAGLNAANGASITFNVKNGGALLSFGGNSTAGNSLLTNSGFVYLMVAATREARA